MSDSSVSNHLLQSVLEGFVEGIIVLTERREVIYRNTIAEEMCARLSGRSSQPIPPEVNRVYQALLESAELYAERPVTIELEIPFQETTFRIRAQWLKLQNYDRPCILVRLQDQKQTLQGSAMAEAHRWLLSKREAEVWMLRRLGYKRRQIASELYIAEDTVKKHLKNIQFKRQCAIDNEEWQLEQAS